MASEKAGAPVRVRFTVQDDINILREVYATNPFEDPRRWDQVALLISHGTGKNFTKRAIRDRVDLLLAQFQRNDRANLAKSGTEEEYDEKCHLLQDVLDMAKEYGYTIKKTATSKVAAGRPLSRPGAAAEKALASTTRDVAAAAFTPYVEGPVSPPQPNQWLQGTSQSVADELEAIYIIEEEENLDLHNTADHTSADHTSNSINSQDTSNGLASSTWQANSNMPAAMNITQAATGTPRNVQPTAATPTRDAAQQGKRGPSKRKDPDDTLEFFQKRLDHDIIWRQKEYNIERERIDLEHKRIALEKEKLEQKRQEWLAERREREEESRLRMELIASLQQQLQLQSQERAEERRIFVAQQNASLELIKTLMQHQQNK